MATAIPVINDLPEDNSSMPAPVQASFWSRAKARVTNIAKRIASPIATAGRVVKANAIKAAVATKRTAVKAGTAVKRTTFKVGAAIKRTALKVVAKIRGKKSGVPSQRKLWRVRIAGISFFAKAKAWIADTWTRVLRPFLKLRAVAFAIIAVVIGLVVAPLTTLVVAFTIGFGLWSLSYGIEHLEASSAPAARWTLKAIEFIAQGLKALVYIVTAALTIAMCVGSIVFAVTEVLELVLRYFNVGAAVSISTALYFLLTGNWLLLAITLLWAIPSKEGLRRRSVDQQTVKPSRGNHRVAKDDGESRVKGWDKVQTAGGSVPHADQPRKFVFEDETAPAPRRVQLPKCTACHQDDSGGRYGLRHHKGLCGKCFSKLIEEDLFKAIRAGKVTKSDIEFAERHGVKVPVEARRAVNAQPISRRHTLTIEEIENTSAVHLSKEDPTKVYWVEIAWWFDGRGVPHTREWLGVVGGESVASIEYDHDRKRRGYTAWLLGKNADEDKKLQTFDKLESAKNLIADELADQANLIGGMLDGLREDAAPATEATPVTVVGKVLGFTVSETTFESPEAHIEHVRKTLGDDAANKLEEEYLQAMLAKDSAS